jgi:hypothetical protein
MRSNYCNAHGGYGFINDCVICLKDKENKMKTIILLDEQAEALNSGYLVL